MDIAVSIALFSWTTTGDCEKNVDYWEKPLEVRYAWDDNRIVGGNPPMVSLGIDIGTTNITIAALDLDKAVILESHTLPNPRLRTTDQFSYLQDPYVIENTVRTLLSRLHQPYACASVTGQVHGILYVDEAGNAVSPLQTWLDRSALEPIEGCCAQQRLLVRCGKTMPNGMALWPIMPIGFVVGSLWLR